MIHLKTHTGDKQYQYTYCDIAYEKISYIESYIRTHNKENPYKGSSYDMTFTVIESSCNDTHWRETIELQYQRQYFSYNAHLKTYKYIQWGKAISVYVYCNKVFSANSNLVRYFLIQQRRSHINVVIVIKLTQ